MEKVPAVLTERAKAMRTEATPAERALWQHLRGGNLGVKFRRQLARGRYIVDFICLSHTLIVEVDGDQHAESAYDALRDAWLVEQGYRVLRFGNRDVLGNVEGVVETIMAALQERC